MHHLRVIALPPTWNPRNFLFLIPEYEPQQRLL